MQNYIYQGAAKPSGRDGNEGAVARLVRKVRQALESLGRDGNGSHQD